MHELLTTEPATIWPTFERAYFQEHDWWANMTKIVVPYVNKLAYVNELTTAYAAIESATALVDAPRDLDFNAWGGVVSADRAARGAGPGALSRVRKSVKC